MNKVDYFYYLRQYHFLMIEEASIILANPDILKVRVTKGGSEIYCMVCTSFNSYVLKLTCFIIKQSSA